MTNTLEEVELIIEDNNNEFLDSNFDKDRKIRIILEQIMDLTPCTLCKAKSSATRKEVAELQKDVLKECEDKKILKKIDQHIIKGSTNFLQKVNSYAYAFGLIDESFLSSKHSILKRNYPVHILNSDLVFTLIKHLHFSEIPHARYNSEDDIAIYFNNGCVTNAAIVTEHNFDKNYTKVKSKWGNINIYEHYLFHVPEKYGNEVRFYKLNNKYSLIETLKEYYELSIEKV